MRHDVDEPLTDGGAMTEYFTDERTLSHLNTEQK